MLKINNDLIHDKFVRINQVNTSMQKYEQKKFSTCPVPNKSVQHFGEC